MQVETINLNITGMSCVNCSKTIEKNISIKRGIIKIDVSFASSEAQVKIDTDIYSKQSLINDIKKLGYEADEDLSYIQKEQEKEFKKLEKLYKISLSIMVLMFILAFTDFVAFEIKKYLMFVLATFVQFYCGKRFYVLSWKAIQNRNYDMNVLVALGTSAAYFYSSFVVFLPFLFPEHLKFIYFDGAVVIISFVLLGRYLEEKSKQKASDYLQKLLNLAPLNANLIIKDEIKTVLAKDLNISDIVLVKAGEKIPSDGVIVEGSCDIDASMITGESMPIFVDNGDSVLSGTLNTNSVIKVKILKHSSDTTISKIITLLKTAQSKQIPISRFADKVANIFVPTVVFISVFTFLIWGFIVGDFQSAIITSISVLIISCPCALGLATPIAIVSSVSRGAKEGILIKNPEILEQIKDIGYALFDKTGTLTKGEIVVSDTDINSEHFELIGSIEKYSEHPISKAIVNYLKDKKCTLDKEIKDIEIIAGKGIKVNYKNTEILLGNKRLLDENKVDIRANHLEFYNKHLDKGSGLVLISINKESIGSFCLEDSLRDGAVDMINHLKKFDVKPILLTGDNKTTALKIANKLNIEDVYFELLPTQKYEKLKSLQKNSKVLFVGDGINDALSIKQANIGITLNSGSDISKDAGDIILINNDLKSVVKSINLSNETMNVVKQNLFWAFFYNILGIPLAAGILFPFFGFMLTPAYAGIAMSFSSLTVVLNSLRLKMKSI